jgi:hypothetical protein
MGSHSSCELHSRNAVAIDRKGLAQTEPLISG